MYKSKIAAKDIIDYGDPDKTIDNAKALSDIDPTVKLIQISIKDISEIKNNHINVIF